MYRPNDHDVPPSRQKAKVVAHMVSAQRCAASSNAISDIFPPGSVVAVVGGGSAGGVVMHRPFPWVVQSVDFDGGQHAGVDRDRGGVGEVRDEGVVARLLEVLGYFVLDLRERLRGGRRVRPDLVG